MAPSELVREYKTTISQIILVAQQQGYTVLGWDQYQKLLDEIANLIGGDEEPDRPWVYGNRVTFANYALRR